MDETLEYWQEKLVEFQEALQLEEQMDEREDSMYRLLKLEIKYCQTQINLLSND